MDSALKKVLFGAKDSVKWILGQYAIVAIISLIWLAVLYVISLITSDSFRSLLLSHPLGTHSAYGYDDALLLAIPIYSVLFSFWHSFFCKRSQRWTIVIPWMLLIGLFFIIVAIERNWDIRIITIDEFMLAGWLSPIFGIIVNGIWCLFSRKRAVING